MGSTEERTIVDVDEGSGSFGSLVEQHFDGNGYAHIVGGRDESEVFITGTKRKKPASDNPHAGKKYVDPTVEALEKLVELSDRRSKIVEQSDSEENYSYKLCIDKLTVMPSITAEEIFVRGKAIKQRDEHIFFLSIPPMAVSFWLQECVSEFRHHRQQRQQGCQSGRRSFMAATDLSSAGFTSIVDIAGGYLAWVETGLPSEHHCILRQYLDSHKCVI
ncbi:hypothetical protein J5N97_023831 [Dioscorea zingiberensis]|uniref:Rhodanese domain-containing protein n=1 Tax=Dioscorea zingiberensis TaxID=325984 RepID=A0A9D5C6B7_9LILI|nr:hypothetical protein J5N97_023831 [Dioscorea zingiberensis]